MTFEENFVFETYKDTGFISSGDFKRKVKDFSRIDTTKVYREVINYQIKKYGRTLIGSCTLKVDSGFNQKQEINKVKDRKKYQRKIKGIETRNSKRKRWTEQL